MLHAIVALVGYMHEDLLLLYIDREICSYGCIMIAHLLIGLLFTPLLSHKQHYNHKHCHKQ